MPLMCYCDNTHLDDFNQEHHGLGCKAVSEDRIRRHDMVQHLLIQFLERLFPACEIIEFKRVQDEAELNAGAPEAPKIISDFQLTLNRRKYFIDIDIVNPSSPSYMAKQPSSIFTPLVAALCEQIRKRGRYERFLPTPDEFRFIPFVVESTSRFGTVASEFIDQMCELWQKTFNQPDEGVADIRRYLVRTINAAIVRGNAQIVRKFKTQTVPPVFPDGSFH